MDQIEIDQHADNRPDLPSKLSNLAILPIPTNRAKLVAFRIIGRVTRDDMQFMGAVVTRAMTVFDEIDMLLIFEESFGVLPGANLTLTALKAELRSVKQVRRYVTVGAPAPAKVMIRAMGAMLGMDAKTFARDEEARAWASVEAAPTARDDRLSIIEWETMAAVNLRAHLAQSENGRTGIAAAVLSEGKVMALSANEVHRQSDATRHAEMVAIDFAAETLGQSALTGCTLLSSLQPCEMCLAAARFAGMGRIIFAARKAEVVSKYFAFPGLELEDFQAASSQGFTVIGGIQEETMLPLYEQGAA